MRNPISKMKYFLLRRCTGVVVTSRLLRLLKARHQRTTCCGMQPLLPLRGPPERRALLLTLTQSWRWLLKRCAPAVPSWPPSRFELMRPTAPQLLIPIAYTWKEEFDAFSEFVLRNAHGSAPLRLPFNMLTASEWASAVGRSDVVRLRDSETVALADVFALEGADADEYVCAHGASVRAVLGRIARTFLKDVTALDAKMDAAARARYAADRPSSRTRTPSTCSSCGSSSRLCGQAGCDECDHDVAYTCNAIETSGFVFAYHGSLIANGFGGIAHAYVINE